MTEELETLKLVIDKLEEGNFSYYLTGSMAMSFYSVPRMTRDSDIIIQLLGKDVDKFVKLFVEEFFTDENMIKDSLKSGMMFNIFHKKNFFKIDFILKTGEEYEEVKFERSNRLRINGFDVNVISIEDLIISKLYRAKERFNKMLSMCQTVREIILSQMPAGLSEPERRKRLFEIYYRQDFSDEEFEKLLKKFFPNI